MHPSRIARSLLVLAAVSIVFLGGSRAVAQTLQVEVGGGWAIPTSSVDMAASVEEGGEALIPVDPGSGPDGYVAAGLEWTLSSHFAAAGLVRVQQSWMRGDKSELTSEILPCRDGECTVSREPDGRLRAATLEGRIVLTSTGWIKPYFLVGLGVVQTTLDGARVEGGGNQDVEDFVIRFSESTVTDAGGDVGFGALLNVVADLSLAAEIRATGSLPGAKENAVTTFPFTLGLSYRF